MVEVGLGSSIRGDILQEAVNATLRRMPYFSDALAERNGDFYYAVNPLPFEEQAQRARALLKQANVPEPARYIANQMACAVNPPHLRKLKYSSLLSAAVLRRGSSHNTSTRMG